MAQKKAKATELNVFKGREAKLNRAIFQTLIIKEPQTIYEIHGQIRKCFEFKRAHYANVNKRVRALEHNGYLRKANIQKTKAGFEAAVYETTSRAHLALLLNSISLSRLVETLDEAIASEIFSALASAIEHE